MLVAPYEIIQMQQSGAMSVRDAPHVGALLHERWTNLTDPPPGAEVGRNVISVEALDQSFALLRSILAADDGRDLLGLVALAMRGLVAHDNQDFDPALIQSWALVER